MPADPCTVLRCDKSQLVSRGVEYSDSVWVKRVCMVYLQPHRIANPKLTNVMSPVIKCYSYKSLKLQMLGRHGCCYSELFSKPQNLYKRFKPAQQRPGAQCQYTRQVRKGSLERYWRTPRGRPRVPGMCQECIRWRDQRNVLPTTYGCMHVQSDSPCFMFI